MCEWNGTLPCMDREKKKDQSGGGGGGLGLAIVSFVSLRIG